MNTRKDIERLAREIYGKDMFQWYMRHDSALGDTPYNVIRSNPNKLLSVLKKRSQ
jgi:hypothetical protein